MNSTIRHLWDDDEGSALLTVIAMSVVLFMLVVGLLVIQQYYTGTVKLRTQRVDATHVADAGLNDYLVGVKRDNKYYLTVPDTGWVDFEGGQYRVTADPPENGSPLVLHATGRTDETVTIAATVRYPTFADYIVLSDSNFTIDSGDTVGGEVRSNGSVTNNGHITGQTYAVNTIGGTGTFDQGKYAGYAPADFNLVGVSKDDVMSAAISDGSYFGPVTTGVRGYKVTFTGTSYAVEKVADDNGVNTGVLNTTPVGTYTIPGDGAVFFDAPVFLSGDYGANVAIASSSDAYLIGSFERTSDVGKYTCGVIANGSVMIPMANATVPQDMVVESAIVAQNGKFTAILTSGSTRHSLSVVGSVAYKDASGSFQLFDPFTGLILVSGFQTYNLDYDQLLDMQAPPFYPFTGDSALKVATWIEDGGVNK